VPKHCLRDRAYIYPLLGTVDRLNKQTLHKYQQTALAAHNSHRILQTQKPHPPTQRRRCYCRSADLQAQRLIALQLRNRLRIRTCELRPLIMTRFSRQDFRLVKPKFRICLKDAFQSSERLSIHLQRPQTRWCETQSSRSFDYMFEYLTRTRRICK